MIHGDSIRRGGRMVSWSRKWISLSTNPCQLNYFPTYEFRIDRDRSIGFSLLFSHEKKISISFFFFSRNSTQLTILSYPILSLFLFLRYLFIYFNNKVNKEGKKKILPEVATQDRPSERPISTISPYIPKGSPSRRPTAVARHPSQW